MGFDFVDTDLVICKREGKKLQEIIDTEGLEKFLEIEQQVGEEISPVNSVVATGGSMILSDEAMKNLKKDGIVVYVEVPLKILKKRITIFMVEQNTRAAVHIVSLTIFFYNPEAI